MHELRPGRVVEPERGGAALAEIPLAGARLAVAVASDLGAEDAEARSPLTFRVAESPMMLMA